MINDIEDYGRITKKIKEIFLEVFPEWEDLPTGHRVFQVYDKIKNSLYDEIVLSPSLKAEKIFRDMSNKAKLPKSEQNHFVKHFLTASNSSDIMLAHCDKCNQMTNHNVGDTSMGIYKKCLKCGDVKEE